jgi:cytochrome c biogenesis protein CcmG, thiol:disulfide interchange protein DsbE
MKKLDMLRIAPFIVFLLLMLAVANGLFTPPEARVQTSAMIGKQLPDIALSQAGAPGSMFLSNEWKGQAAVINIFASWCEPCKAEHPLLMQLAQMQDVNLFGIAWKDSETNIVNYLTGNGNPYRNIGMDPIGTTTLFFGITGLPETYVVDKRNVVRFKHAGPLTPDVASNALIPLLRQLNAEP